MRRRCHLSIVEHACALRQGSSQSGERSFSATKADSCISETSKRSGTVEINKDRLAAETQRKMIRDAVFSVLDAAAMKVPEIPPDCLKKQTAWLSVPTTFDLAPWSKLQKKMHSRD